ncbi:viscotoxin-A3 [Adlercreutzia agrestimuris]|uniref:viscotoxin-A3 n=1 Tax=Adlercreutzia agrestimuris TaxID=2941324 RepID=UPI00203E444C|nr:viscotoxin-A3 [Adlercreutzia agrestimuris]
MVELTDEQIAQEEAFLEGIPRINIGALFLPPVWGAAHGFWVSLLFYPLWLVADNLFFAAYTERTFFSIAIALVVFISLLLGTIAFSLIGQPLAAHRAAAQGLDKPTYLRRQKVWAVVSVVVGLIMIASATYYNLFLRAGL